MLSITACGGGSDNGDVVVDQQLTTTYVNTELNLDGYEATGTTLVYDVGSSGAQYNFKRIITGKANNSVHGDVFIYAYSLLYTRPVASNRYVMFYIDSDNDLSTGVKFEGIGADHLLASH